MSRASAENFQISALALLISPEHLYPFTLPAVNPAIIKRCPYM